MHHWKVFDLEITGSIITFIRHPQMKLCHLKRQTLKHVEEINVSEKPTYDTSLERSRLGDHRFQLSP